MNNENSLGWVKKLNSHVPNFTLKAGEPVKQFVLVDAQVEHAVLTNAKSLVLVKENGKEKLIGAGKVEMEYTLASGEQVYHMSMCSATTFALLKQVKSLFK